MCQIYPTKKKRTSKIFLLSSPFNANCHNIFISDQILVKLECGVDEYLCLQCVETKRINANGKLYSLILSTWNFEYALQLQSTKSICFRYVWHPLRLLMLFVIPKSIFTSQDSYRVEIFTCFVRFISSMESFLKGSHTKGATKLSIIVYGEIKDRICKEKVSEYHLVY